MRILGHVHALLKWRVLDLSHPKLVYELVAAAHGPLGPLDAGIVRLQIVKFGLFLLIKPDFGQISDAERTASEHVGKPHFPAAVADMALDVEVLHAG